MSTAAALSPSNPAPSPGALRGGAHLQLHTRHAARLIRGRRPGERPGIVGLYGFTRMLQPVWNAAAKDDPYADWWLMQIESRLNAANAAFEDRKSELQEIQNDVPQLQLLPPTSTQPVTVELSFANPLAFEAASLLGGYDSVIALLLAAQHVGLTEPEHIRDLIRDTTRCTRAAFFSPAGYTHLGITREEVRARTGIALVADERMPGLPQDVLQRTVRARRHPLFRKGLVPDRSISQPAEPNCEDNERSRATSEARADGDLVTETTRDLEAPPHPFSSSIGANQ